eukprot:SAG22_NODE_1_length_62449_cov_158.689270_52_plen_929_part_00
MIWPAIIKCHWVAASSSPPPSAKCQSWRPDIVYRTSDSAGRTWGPVCKLYSEPHNTIGNPSPVLDAKHPGTIVLTFCRNNLDVLVLRSTDAGSSWDSKPTDISKTVVKPAWHWVATGPPAGVQLDSGRMVVCADHEPGNGGSVIGSHAMYSDDFGHSWNLSADDLPNGDECSIAPAPNGTLLMNMRTAQERRQFSVSTSDGVSWSPPTTGPFQFKGLSNGCEGAMIRMPSSNRMVFSQPYSAAGRLNMSLHVSDESGASWQDLRQVDPGVSGYSALAAVNSTHVDLAWETSPILAGRNSTLRVCINAGLRFGSIRFQTLSVKTDAPIKSDDDENSEDGTSSRIEVSASGCGPPPTVACQRQLDAYCNATATACPLACAESQPNVARCLPGDPSHGQTTPGWRCYAASNLTANRSAYEGGDCYCTDAVLVKLLCSCSNQTNCPAPPPAPSPAPPVPAPPGLPAQRGVIKVFGDGESGYYDFLNPAVIRTDPGQALLIFAEARKGYGGDFDQVDIAMKRSTSSGMSWGPLRTVASDKLYKSTYGNLAPVVVRGAAPAVLLVWCVNNSRVYTMRSSDSEGVVWGAIRDITPQVNKRGWGWMATGPANAIVTSKGRILVPVDAWQANRSEMGHLPDNALQGTSRCLISDDGELWTVGEPVNSPNGTDECAIAELADGSIIMSHRMNARAATNGCHHFAKSTDHGSSFQAYETNECLPDPTCQASLLAVQGGKSVLLAGPLIGAGMPPGYNRSNGSPPDRVDLTVYKSHDGRSWSELEILFHGSSEYSSMVQIGAESDLVGIAFVADSREYIGWRLLSSSAVVPEPPALACPVSFTYEYGASGHSSADLLPGWKKTSTDYRISGQRTRERLSYIDAELCSQLFIDRTVYHDFDHLSVNASEYTPTFRFDSVDQKVSSKLCNWSSLVSEGVMVS